MAGRGAQTFKKRQREQQRKEKQEEKRAKRLERKRQGDVDPTAEPESLDDSHGVDDPAGLGAQSLPNA